MSHHGIHTFIEQVRFEDVDAMAMVYHPIYLTYLERARCQFLIDQGSGFKSMLEAGFGIVVASAEMKFIRPLTLEDRFVVATQIDQRAKSVLHMTQVIAMRQEEVVRTSLKEELRSIETMRFYAHLKLSVISLTTKAPATPPDWIADVLSV
jgi:acyl-CoA thioester hydrolase